MNRQYFDYRKWECFEFGMYESIAFMDQEKLINECVQLLNCKEWLWESMTYVSHNWIHSAMHNLTNTNRNRQAWLGQAACCLSHGAPEYVTKLAWNRLSPQEMSDANSVADDVIRDWEDKYNSGYFFRMNPCLKHT